MPAWSADSCVCKRRDRDGFPWEVEGGGIRVHTSSEAGVDERKPKRASARTRKRRVSEDVGVD